MKRALFSNEAGEGSSPMAHSAAKTSEPVREGIVAGLEPFIDTLVVCTFTALVILTTGIWNRPVDVAFTEQPRMVAAATPGSWSIPEMPAPHAKGIDWVNGQAVYAIVSGDLNPQSDNTLHRINGLVEMRDDVPFITWGSVASAEQPSLDSNGVFLAYVGATLTAKAFDTVSPGLGKWLITLSVWMFAISTIISWAYYGEQGVVYLIGERAVTGYKLIYCLLIAVATLGLIKTDAQLDNITGIGTGVMILANLPILWLGSRQAITAYKEYVERLKNGELGPGHTPPSLEDLVTGRDVK
jgi:AGCS family alanine or glycine:cation symporter